VKLTKKARAAATKTVVAREKAKVAKDLAVLRKKLGIQPETRS
jgi:hypothetical protein